MDSAPIFPEKPGECSPSCVVLVLMVAPVTFPKSRGFFARMERSMLAADAERVVAKGEMTEEEPSLVTATKTWWFLKAGKHQKWLVY